MIENNLAFNQSEILKDFNNDALKLILIDIIKMRVSFTLYKNIYEYKTANSLESQLGKIVINSTSSICKIICLPIKLIIFWYKYNKIPLKFGNNFENLINEYKQNGALYIENILDSSKISNKIRANAYTELSRALRHIDTKMSAEYAWLAYMFDPQEYRLKWLAFRIYEENETIISYAILEILSNNIKMSSWEQSQKEKINKNANAILQNNANEIQKKIFYDLDKIKIKYFNQEQTISDLKEQLTLSNNIKNSLQKELISLNNSLQHNKKFNDDLKKENERLVSEIAYLIKNILTKYETDKQVVSTLLKIIFKET